MSWLSVYCRHQMRITESLAIVGSMQFGLSGPLDCHVYALRGPDGVILIDAGAGTHTEQILRNTSVDLPGHDIAALLVTHSHLDHSGGAAMIRQRTGCRVVTPEPSRYVLERADEEACGLRAAREQGVYPSDFRLQACGVDEALHDGQVFVAGGVEFLAIHVRGHSQDAFCYLTHGNTGISLFSGDVVFYGGVLGVINLEGSGMDGYRADFHKLGGRNIQGFFPGHGLFTICGGQSHIDCAMKEIGKGFLPRQIGQGDLLF